MVGDGKTRGARERECERKLFGGGVRKRVMGELERETKRETAGERYGAWFN